MPNVGSPTQGERSTVHSLLMYLKYIPDVFLVGALAAIELNNLCSHFFHRKLFDSPEVLRNIAPLIITAALLFLYRLLMQIRNEIRPLHKLAGEVIQVLPGEGAFECANLMTSCNCIDVLTLSGSIMIPLENSDVSAVLRDPKRKSQIRCLIANSLAEPIKTRYERDEPDWKETGTEAIETRAIWLFNTIGGLDDIARQKIDVKVYDTYPIVSVFRADDEVYSSYYGYKLRGMDTPMVKAGLSSYYGKALIKHFERLYQDAIPLERWVAKSYSILKGRHKLRFQITYSGVFLSTPEQQFICQRRDTRRRVSNPGMLSVFGGRAENGETSIQAALRELKEETGLRKKESDLEFVTTQVELISEGRGEQCVLCTYYLLRNVETRSLNQREGAGYELSAPEILADRDDFTDGPKSVLRAVQSVLQGKTAPPPQSS